ncbi:Reverse transcriptase domain [Trinorchestia longiramus]|nr:Reverse transcriptase domain [Trinorchestia longiramus]
MTTIDLSINGLEVTDKIGDHQMIVFSLEVQDPNTRTQHKQVLDYNRVNFELMKRELSSHNYEVLMINKNADEYYMILKDKIATATEHYILRNISDQNLIADTQHSFREKCSCLRNLLDFFGEVNCIYDRTKAVDFVYLDLQKAFDKVPHERLMAKVEAHGRRGNYSRWIRNWLTSRTQRVVIHDQASDSTRVTSGVPQGSVLDLLLFIIFINGLDVGIISKINKFADDTKLCHRAFTERDRVTIQSDLNRLLQRTESWQMSFNIEKCSALHVGVNNGHFQHTMYDIPIETVQ